MGRYHRVKQGVVLMVGVALVSCTPLVQPSDQSSPLESTAATQEPAASPSPQPLPVADANGDFGRTSHQSWQVVDADPTGLNCRWSAAMPTDWYAPSAQFPDQRFSQWQVVRQFAAGTPLTANLAPAGFAVLYDEQQKPWLKVSMGEDEQICLVKANAAYVQPVAE